MEYRKFGNTIVARMDRGEEIVASVLALAEREGVRLAGIQALGAIDRFTVGVFNTETKQYLANEFSGAFEIVSLTGTLSTMDGKPYCHLHLSAGNEKGEVFGGHLNRARISATCEMVLQLIDGQVDRSFSEEIGLNLFRF